MPAPATTDMVYPSVQMMRELFEAAVLPVTGLKDRMLAANRAGLRHIVIPQRNAPDLEEIPEEVRAGLTVHLIRRVDEVLPLVLDAGAAVDGLASASRSRDSAGSPRL